MNTINKIRDEIERRLKYTHDWLRGDEKRHPKQTSVSKNYYKMKGDERTLDALLSFLDTLEEETSYDTQKYTPSPSVDIGDIARVQFASHAKVFDKKRKAVFDWEQFKEVAGIFYGFGKKDPTLADIAEKYAEKLDISKGWFDGCEIDELIKESYKAGAEWQKELMMEEAVEGEVVKDISNKLAVTAKINLDGFKFGDKVRIIILPKEDGE